MSSIETLFGQNKNMAFWQLRGVPFRPPVTEADVAYGLGLVGAARVGAKHGENVPELLEVWPVSL